MPDFNNFYGCYQGDTSFETIQIAINTTIKKQNRCIFITTVLINNL